MLGLLGNRRLRLGLWMRGRGIGCERRQFLSLLLKEVAYGGVFPRLFRSFADLFWTI